MAPPFRWRFYDPVLDQTLVMPINPNSGALPQMEKNITPQPLSAPDAPPVWFEGQDAPLEFPFSGAILTKEHFEFFRSWYRKRYQVRVTDDLGNIAWIYLTSFKPTRRVRTRNRWSATYEATAIVLSWEIAP